MNYYIGLFFIISGLVSCRENEVSASVSTCYPAKNVTRSQRVVDAPVMVRVSGGLYTGFQLVAGNGVAWSACNLPNEFKRDSLEIQVSGYFLTFPDLEFKNISPLPFEITGAKMK